MFSFLLPAVFVALAVVAPTEVFARGLVPGWLFGAFGAVVMSTFGVSWVDRLRHDGSALELSEHGIRANPRLGGPASPRIANVIPWDEVTDVEPGKYNSVIVRLKDPDAFWLRQSLVSRFLGWNPLRGNRLSLGGNDIEATSSTVISTIEDWIEWRRLASPEETSALPPGDEEL